MVGVKVLSINQITDKADFELWGFMDVYSWGWNTWEVDLRYLLGESDLESSGLKPKIISYFGLLSEDAEQVSERIRVTIPMTLRLDQTKRHVEVLRNSIAFYDRYADGGRDDYFVNGLDVSDVWFEAHIIPKLRRCLQREDR